LGWLARRHGETVAVEVTGRVQPFPALYRPAQLERLEAELAAARPLRATLELLQATVVSEQTLRAFGEPRRLCFSVNEPADLDRVARAQARRDRRRRGNRTRAAVSGPVPARPAGAARSGAGGSPSAARDARAVAGDCRERADAARIRRAPAAVLQRQRARRP